MALHPLVSCLGWHERAAHSLHAQKACGVSAQPSLNRVFWDHPTRYVARHGTAPQLVVVGGGGGLNFDVDYPLRPTLSVLHVPHDPPAGGRGP